MPESKTEHDNNKTEESITRKQSAELLNGDLSSEYQASIAYVVYSQVAERPQYMNVTDQVELHAKQEAMH